MFYTAMPSIDKTRKDFVEIFDIIFYKVLSPECMCVSVLDVFVVRIRMLYRASLMDEEI